MSTRKIAVPATLYREFDASFDRADPPAEGAKRSYPLTFSSEKPVRRFDYRNWVEYDEVLSHDPADIDLSRLREPDNRITFLKSHMRDTVIGSITDVSFEKKVGRGNADFATTEPGMEAQKLVDENHVPTVSIGYRVTDMTLVKMDKESGIGTYKCKWALLEVSQEAIPADETVGFNRAQRDHQLLVDFEVTHGLEDGATPTQGDRTMSLVPGATPNVTPTPDGAGGAPAAPVTAASAGRDYRSEAIQITELCNTFRHLFPQGTDPMSRASEWMREGHTPDQVRTALLEMARTPAPHQAPPAAEGLRMDPKAKKLYSYRRAMQICSELREGSNANFNGPEREVHEECARNFQGSKRGGIFVPFRIHREGDELREYQQFASRALGTTEATGGQTLIASELQLDIIELLRNAALTIKAGAQYYTGLQGQIPWPKQTGGSTVNWVAENGGPAAASQPTFGVVNMTPKSMLGVNVVPRQLLTMASFDVEALIRRDLAEGHALAFDYAALAGTGTANKPLGIYFAPNISVEEFNGFPSNDQLVAMTTRLAKANSLMGNLSFMSEPGLAGRLMSKQKFEGASDATLWAGTHLEGVLAGYIARSTNQVPDNLGDDLNQKGLIFGNWRDLVLGSWGNELEILVNPYSLDDMGQIKITSHSMGDVAILRDPSFCRAAGITLA